MRHCARCGNDYPADAAFCPLDGQPLAAASAPPPAGGSKVGVILDGRYELEEKIGAGGLGEIYRARHLRMHRAFAVKLLQRSMVNRPDFVGRFEREARALSRLTHPCCVAVTDYGISEEHGPFIVMELVEGEVLTTISRGDGMPLGEALDLIIAVLAGLDHAHRQGIVHRDIKPDNIMIVEQPLGHGQRMPKILDFGLARIRAGFNAPAGQTLTETGFVIGTPHYLPPERVTNPSADDPRSDLYAVGVLLFELCCGRRPFEAEETPRVVEMHLVEPPPAPRSLRPELPVALEAAILRALQKEPAARFVSAREFREALEALLPLPPEIAKRRPRDAKTVSLRPPPLPAAAKVPPSRGSARTTRERLILWLVPIGVVAACLIAIAAALLLRRGAPEPAAARDAAPALKTVRSPAPPPPPPPARPPAPDSSAPPAAASSTLPAAAGPDEGEPEDEDEPAPPGAAAASVSLAPELRDSYRLWTHKRTRQRAARQFMAYLGQHRSDAASHIFVGRLYLYAFWASDGVRLVQRGLQVDPKLRLDGETLFGLAFGFRGASFGAARRLLEQHAGADAARVMLAAAAGMRDRQIKQRLLAEGRRRLGQDTLARALLDLAEASSCDEQRRALEALPTFDPPCVRVMLALLRSNRCLGAEARNRLR